MFPSHFTLIVLLYTVWGRVVLTFIWFIINVGRLSLYAPPPTYTHTLLGCHNCAVTLMPISPHPTQPLLYGLNGTKHK